MYAVIHMTLDPSTGQYHSNELTVVGGFESKEAAVAYGEALPVQVNVLRKGPGYRTGPVLVAKHLSA